MTDSLRRFVDYLNHLEDREAEAVYLEARRDLDSLIHAVVNHPEAISQDRCDILHQASRDIDRAYENFIRHFDLLKRHVRNLVIESEPEYFVESLRLFDEESQFETVEYKLQRKLQPDDEQVERVLGKLLRYSKWQVPGMIVGPGTDNWIDTLVALDPLYLIDTDPALLDPAYQRFPETYQRRLRLYTVKEHLGQPVLDLLPSGQFGFCLVYNFFNYRPLEMINQWLEEIRVCLRPGGTLLFTFNDCDWAHGVGLAERKYMSYTPGRMLVQKLLALEFRVLEHYHGANNMAWIEAQVPGEISTLRGGQTLAKIVANPQ